MKKIKVPSLQHLARISRGDPDSVRRVLLNLAKNSPTFSYAILHELVRDMLVFNTPYDQIVRGVTEGVKRSDVRDNFLGLLPLIRDYFEGTRADYVHAVSPRLYPVGRELMVPFHPPLIYGKSGIVHFPWLSFWKGNPLCGEQLSLFVTIVEEILIQDPDLEDANFSVLDFSAPSSSSPRELTVINAADVPRLSAARKAEMLAIFAEGLRMARMDFDRISENERVIDKADDQPELFS